jgi:hypothetical protein
VAVMFMTKENCEAALLMIEKEDLLGEAILEIERCGNEISSPHSYDANQRSTAIKYFER